MLDDTRLADHPKMEKAVMRSADGWTFGTLFTLARGQSLAPGTYTIAENVHPDVAAAQNAVNGRTIALPLGWSVQTALVNDEENVADYAALTFSVGRRLWDPRDLPPEVGYLLSDFLQLGGLFTFDNFQTYLTGRGLKYLPLTITHRGYCFHVYEPTLKRVNEAMAEFSALLRYLDALDLPLQQIIWDIYAMVRLDEVMGRAPTEIAEAIGKVAMRVQGRIGKHKASFGYLYKNLPGSQSTQRFTYDMYSK